MCGPWRTSSLIVDSLSKTEEPWDAVLEEQEEEEEEWAAVPD